MKISPTKVAWHEIEKVGMPPAELHKTSDGLPRVFLLRTEFSICTGYVFDDGIGFSISTDIPDSVIAWAIVEGF